MTFAFGGFILDVARRELRRDGQLVGLEPQVFDLLAYLVDHRDRVVSKEDLLEGVWGRLVSDSAMTVRISAARSALGDDGKAQRFIRTLPRKGVRFVADVRPVATSQQPVPAGNERPSLPLPDRPSIAVLRFDNLSGDAEQEYFADGMVGDIITAISKIPRLFVAARNSSFTFKDRPIDVRQVGRNLGVRYVLEGSVRKEATRVRISAQLIDAQDGTHILWAERFDGTMQKVFELQEQVAGKVAAQIEPQLRLREIQRVLPKPVDNLDAYDLHLRALAHFYEYTPEHGLEAIRNAISFANQALDRDSSYAPAAALICVCRVVIRSWVQLTDEECQETLRLARDAIRLGRDDSDVQWMSSMALTVLARDYDAGEAGVERALRINRNSAHAWEAKGWIACYLGRPVMAIDAFEQALRLSPLDPLGFYFKGGLALAYIGAERFEDALRWATEAVLENSRYILLPTRIMVVACAHLGRLEEARGWLARLLQLQPGLTIKAWRSSAASSGKALDVFGSGFRLAGLPEG